MVLSLTKLGKEEKLLKLLAELELAEHEYIMALQDFNFAEGRFIAVATFKLRAAEERLRILREEVQRLGKRNRKSEGILKTYSYQRAIRPGC